MSTPLGWARANILYDTNKGVPKYGSLVEASCLLVWKSRISEEVAKIRATAQASLGGDSAPEAFADYQRMVSRRVEEEKKESMHEKLERLKDMRTIKFKPTDGGGIRKRNPTIRTVRRPK